jgi:putative endonuclease
MASEATMSHPRFRQGGTPSHYPRRSGVSRNPERQPCVYLLASRRNGTLYVGVTSNLAQRVWQHQNDLVEGFTKRYGVHMLVWYQVHATMESAITRERAIKEWRRAWKIALIEKSNPQWRDLSEELG